MHSSARQVLEDPRVFAEKIRAGKSVQRSKDFMIFARIESFIANESLDDALKRAEIYLKAGVDGIMIHSKEDNPEQIKSFAKKYKELFKSLTFGKPLIAVPTTYNKIYDHELRDLGFNIVIHANHLLRGAYQSMEEVAKTILLSERSYEADSLCVPVKKIFEKVGFESVTQRDETRGFSIPVIIPCAGPDSLPEKLGQPGIPKALTKINNKSLLEHQIGILKNVGLRDIIVVTGYEAEHFNISGITYINNENWMNTYAMHSIMLAKEKMKNGFILLYPDIILDEELMKRFLKVDADVTLIGDSSYSYHKHEVDKVLDLIVEKNSGARRWRDLRIIDVKDIDKIGKRIDINEATHEVLSVIKFSEEGAKNFIKVYEDCVKHFEGKFHDSESVHKADFTDIFQEMIYRGFKINFIETHKGWLELHNEKDFELVSDYLKSG